MYVKRGDQDGGIGGYGTHLPQQTHQKCIHMWNNSKEKLTGNQQKDSYSTKAASNISK